jgi:hypothetical protein
MEWKCLAQMGTSTFSTLKGIFMKPSIDTLLCQLRQLEEENERLRQQELQGARITIDVLMSPELQRIIGVSSCQRDNIQLIVTRLASFCQTTYDEKKALEEKVHL